MACGKCKSIKCCCPPKTTVVYKGGSKRAILVEKGAKGDPGPAGPSNLTVANTVFVMKNGNDTTGLVERLDKPFLTIAAARTAIGNYFTSRSATARVLVKVESGTWNENIILDKFVDFDLGNSVINGEITDNKVDFGSTDAPVWTNIIYGQARIYNQADLGAPNTHAMQIWMPNTKLLIHAAELSSKNDNAIAITNTKRTRIVGPVKIFTESLSVNYAVPLEMTQGGYGGYTTSLVEVYDADIYVLPTALAPPISFSYGAANKDQTLSLFNCRVANFSDAGTSGNDAAIAVGNQISSDGAINLYNTVLYSAGGDSIYVNTGRTFIVKYYHSNMANSATGGAGTLTTSLGSLTVNAAVAAEF